MARVKLKRRKISVLSTGLLCLLMLVIMFPFYIMLVGAFKPSVSLIKVPIDLMPFRDFTLKNIHTVFEKSQLFLWLKNSFVISVSVALWTAFIAVTAGTP